jgi:hypothetical protein
MRVSKSGSRRLSPKQKGALRHGERSAYAPHWDEGDQPMRPTPSLARVAWLSRPDPDNVRSEASSTRRFELIRGNLRHRLGSTTA